MAPISAPAMSVSIDRIRRDIEHLATIGRTPTGAVSRPSFSPADQEARRWLQDQCDEHGLTMTTDGIGNVTIRLADGAPEGAPIRTGSHLDTVPEGGRFDGILGSVAVLEVMRVVAEHRPELERPIEGMVFADEEGNYHHLLGSSALVSDFPWEELRELRGRDGDLLVDALAGMGWHPAEAGRTAVTAGVVHAFLELHIEQGPVLATAGTDIGVVSDIVALGGGHVEFTGRQDHAGTTPMAHRLDPMPAAGAFLVQIPDIARRCGDTAVLTCGRVDVVPGGSNVVPQLVRVQLDFRHPEEATVLHLERLIRAAVEDVQEKYGVEATYARESITPPVPLDADLRGRLERNAAARGLSLQSIPSGAGHDSQNMAHLASTAMLFVPSTGGSHNPKEHASWEAIEHGANVLLDTLLDLAGTRRGVSELRAPVEYTRMETPRSS